MTRSTLFELTERLLRLDLAARRGLSGLEAKRADVIGVGAAIARQVLRFAAADALTVSDRGVRWGVAQRLLEGRAF
jgi:exopolyphosphatase/guanosine-5'-triphosphate,3'-diphosphate pyrophosphatase